MPDSLDEHQLVEAAKSKPELFGRQRILSWLTEMARMSLSARGRKVWSNRRQPPHDNGYQPAGRPAPIRPRLPELSAAVAMPLPPSEEGPGIVYALGR